jgi:hypothetical protein
MADIGKTASDLATSALPDPKIFRGPWKAVLKRIKAESNDGEGKPSSGVKTLVFQARSHDDAIQAAHEWLVDRDMEREWRVTSAQKASKYDVFKAKEKIKAVEAAKKRAEAEKAAAEKEKKKSQEAEMKAAEKQKQQANKGGPVAGAQGQSTKEESTMDIYGYQVTYLNEDGNLAELLATTSDEQELREEFEVTYPNRRIYALEPLDEAGFKAAVKVAGVKTDMSSGNKGAKVAKGSPAAKSIPTVLKNLAKVGAMMIKKNGGYHVISVTVTGPGGTNTVKLPAAGQKDIDTAGLARTTRNKIASGVAAAGAKITGVSYAGWRTGMPESVFLESTDEVFGYRVTFLDESGDERTMLCTAKTDDQLIEEFLESFPDAELTKVEPLDEAEFKTIKGSSKSLSESTTSKFEARLAAASTPASRKQVIADIERVIEACDEIISNHKKLGGMDFEDVSNPVVKAIKKAAAYLELKIGDRLVPQVKEERKAYAALLKRVSVKVSESSSESLDEQEILVDFDEIDLDSVIEEQEEARLFVDFNVD